MIMVMVGSAAGWDGNNSLTATRVLSRELTLSTATRVSMSCAFFLRSWASSSSPMVVITAAVRDAGKSDMGHDQDYTRFRGEWYEATFEPQ